MRFSNKCVLWSWTCVDVAFVLTWSGVVRFLVLDPLIFSWLNAYTWDWMCTICMEAKRSMFLKFEPWRNICIFKELELQGAIQSLEATQFSYCWEISLRFFGVKISKHLQMKRVSLFIKFSGRFYASLVGCVV